MLAASGQNYKGIQALRFFAAFLVVMVHATSMVTERIMGIGQRPWHNGNAGVDIFFVISGFVMALSSSSLEGRDDAWRVFLSRRFNRVVPMYWLATTLKVALVLCLPALAPRSRLEPLHLAASYLFLPWRDPGGKISPFLTVGWTLSYEMLFYAVVSAALYARKPAVTLCGGVFIALALLRPLLSPDGPAVYFYTDFMILEFIYGMLIARFFREQMIRPPLAAALLLAGMTAILTVDMRHRWLDWGLPAAMIVAGAVQLERTIGERLPRWLLEQGDASYSLYLFHPFVVPLAGVALVKLRLSSPAAGVAIAAAASLAASLALYRRVELPILRRLRRGARGVEAAAA